ncbi:MAG TPA: hypothetical protein VIK74_09090, partial [Parasegetibacter sp.]
TLYSSGLKAQKKIDSIYFHLYTDSLKKGTFNYINVDGLQAGGRYLPLDSSHIELSATAGKFKGNSLWVEPDLKDSAITITAVLRTDPKIRRSVTIYIKKAESAERLKTIDEIFPDQPTRKKKRKN